MKKEIVMSAKTVEEALELAAKELGVDSVEKIEYTVLEEPKKGLFGIGAVPAKISASCVCGGEADALALVEELIANMNVEATVAMSDGEIAAKIKEMFDLRPKAIERKFKLRQPMYLETAAYGHMGRKNEVVTKTFTSHYHETRTIDVELFTWEKLDSVDNIRKAFDLK